MATYYRDCSELSIHLFHKILETGQYSLLVTEGKLSEEELSEIWENIYTEYCKLSEDNTSLMYFALCSELLYLDIRYTIASQLLGQIITIFEHTEVVKLYIAELAKWDYKIDVKKPISQELDRMFVKLKQSKNKIDRKKKELEGYKNEEEPMPLTQQAVKLAKSLGKDRIDTKETMVDEWIYLIKELKEVNEAQKKLRK